MAVLRGDGAGDNRIQYLGLVYKGEQEVTCSPLYYMLFFFVQGVEGEHPRKVYHLNIVHALAMYSAGVV